MGHLNNQDFNGEWWGDEEPEPILRFPRDWDVYQYLLADAKEAAWRDVGAYLAHDDDAAVRYHIAESGAETSTYRAVVRSAWEPLIRIKVIKTTKLTLEHGEASKRRRPSNPVAKPEPPDLAPDPPSLSDPGFFDPDEARKAAVLEGAPA